MIAESERLRDELLVDNHVQKRMHLEVAVVFNQAKLAELVREVCRLDEIERSVADAAARLA